MELSVQKFETGQAVYAKIKGYPPWPAFVTHIPKDRKVARVQYFNSGLWNELSFAKLTPFHAGKGIVEKYLNKNGAFTKAYHEMLLMMQPKQKAEKKEEMKSARIVLCRLTPIEIQRIRSDLKRKKMTKTEAKNRLRSGRIY